jgi:hypothetical protein
MGDDLQKGLDRASACILVILPVVLLVYDVVIDTATVAGFVFGFVGVMVIAASLLALARLAWATHPLMTLLAGALGVAGLFGTMDITSSRFLAGTIRSTPLAVGDPASFGAAIQKVSPFIFFPGLLTPFVLLMFAAMLLRAEPRYRWAWACVGMGALLFPLARIQMGPVGILISDALMLIGLGYRAYRLVGDDDGRHALSPARSA